MKRIHPLKRFYKTVDKTDIAYKLQNIPSFPYILEFEVTNNCNFHCLMCKTGMSTAKRERGYMSCDTYKKIIDEIKGKQIALKFVGQGEPLLHPNFPEFVKEAEENGIVCHLTTNASLLDEDMMDKLFSAGLESIKFSFQGVTREGYLEMRQKDNFEQLMNTISKLYDKRGNKERPYITIHTTVTDESEKQIETFRERAQAISDEVQIGKTTLEFMELENVSNLESRERLAALKKRETLKKVRYNCCNQVFDVMTVRWNGDISACCADNDGVMTIGNVKDNSLLELWNGTKLQSYRSILKDNRFNDLPLCKDCYDFMGYMQKENRAGG